jgi:hypothetical protein
MADLRQADDGTIPDDELLYFRIHPAGDAIVPAGNGQYRPNSGTLRGYPDEPLSCDLSSLSSPEQSRDRGTNGSFHVAAITAGAIRQMQVGQQAFRVWRDPIVNGPVPNNAHAVIAGNRVTSGNQIGGLTNGEAERIARASRIILFATGYQPPDPVI